MVVSDSFVYASLEEERHIVDDHGLWGLRLSDPMLESLSARGRHGGG